MVKTNKRERARKEVRKKEVLVWLLPVSNKNWGPFVICPK